MSSTRFVCIMPFLNEGAHLPAVLASIEAQDFPRERLYFVAVDNGSNDGGPELVRDWLQRTGTPGVLVRADVRSIPFALNTGLAHATAADTVVRLDAHTIYERHYLSTIDTAFETIDEDIWCVGGAPTPAPSVDFSSALGEALYSNPMGLGPADFRKTPETAGADGSSPAIVAKRVTTVYLGAWRPGVLQSLGGFDERWEANEDCELSERMSEAGGATARVPVECGRICTRGPVSTVKQWGRYGFWRAQTFRKYPSAVRPRHVVAPAALVIALTLLITPFRLALAPLYGLYALATIAMRRRGEKPMVTAASLVFFPFVHSWYALGLIIGTLRSAKALRSG